MRINDTFRFNGSHKACGTRFSVLASFQFTPYRRPLNGLSNRDGSTFWRAEDGREFDSARNGDHALEYVCPACGPNAHGVRPVLYARPVLGKFRADKKCDGRCLAATGHNCECACGGKNHGAANA